MRSESGVAIISLDTQLRDRWQAAVPTSYPPVACSDAAAVPDGTFAVAIDATNLDDPLEVLAEVRHRYGGALFVLMLVDKPEGRFLMDCIRAGVDDIMESPFDFARIAASLDLLYQQAILTSDRVELVRKLRTSKETFARQEVALSREIARANRDLYELNRTLKRHVSQLTILYQMGRDISENENWSDAIDRFLMALVNYIRADGAALLLFSEGTSRLALRSNFQVDPPVLAQSCQVLLENWKRHPRGGEMHAIESYRTGEFISCLERQKPWRFTVMALRYRNRPLGFMLIEKDYRSGAPFRLDYHFLNTIQTIMSEEVANATYISELRQLSRFNNKVLNNIDAGVVTTDLTGRILYSNECAERLCPSVAGKSVHFDDVFLSGDETSLYDRVLSSDHETHIMEIECRNVADSTLPVRVSITRMHDDNLNGTVLVAIFEDLSERKRMEEEIRRNDRLRVLGQMSASVAHEIRNPLTGIATTAEVLAGKMKDDPDRTVYIRTILDEIRRLDQIIRALLTYARPPRPQFAACSLNQVSNHVVGLVSDQAKQKGVAVALKDDLGDAVCRADRDQVTQVLLNLVTNSVQACESGDEIEIGLSEEKLQGVSARRFARIDIADTGPGIPQTVRDRLFEPFVTTKTSGTGLGLAISQKIIEEHEGRISCAFLKTGTRFTIRLPMQTVERPQAGNEQEL